MSKQLINILKSFNNNIHGDFDLIYKYYSERTIYKCDDECHFRCHRGNNKHVDSLRLHPYYNICGITFSIFNFDKYIRIKFYNLTQIIKYDIMELNSLLKFKYRKSINNINKSIKLIETSIYDTTYILYYMIYFIKTSKITICNIGLHIQYFIPKINFIHNNNYISILQKLDELKLLQIKLLIYNHKKNMKYIDYNLEECDVNIKLLNSIEKSNVYNFIFNDIINQLSLITFNDYIYCCCNLTHIYTLISEIYKYYDNNVKYDKHINHVLYDYYLNIIDRIK